LAGEIPVGTGTWRWISIRINDASIYLQLAGIATGS
jgi:hypothetical protein